MCGIGGILGGHLAADERESAALRLQAALRHRGPDGHGLFTSGHATLVHTRLAILDPGAAGRQPMTRGPHTITFSGEIYNFRSRRADLAQEGESFTTSTDTEVLLALHARHGAAALPLLRGMFAFAIWDARDESCVLARDPFGIKPLYHARLPGGGLVFASELRALLATGLVARRIDPAGLDGYLATGSVPEPHTLIAGVECLRAGHVLHWREGLLSDRTYFTVGFAQEPCGPPIDLRAALADSVAHHQVSDVPVGLLLSGGLDSSALLALAQSGGRDPLLTFSIGVEDASLDESGSARALARHFGTRHHEMLLTQELARHWIEDFLDAIDQPTLDGFNVYCACKLAADHGCKVVLSGLGADELFGGYPSFRCVPALRRAGRLLRGVPLPTRIGGRFAPGGRARRACDYLAGPASLERAYGAFRGVFTAPEIVSLRPILLPGTADAASSIRDEEPEAEASATDPGDMISQLELTRYLRNQLLRDADVMSMAHGVELRVPLLDLPLLAALRRVPAAQRLRPGKSLLREAVPELPLPLLAPRKRGFSLPFGSWFERDWIDLSAGLPLLPQIPMNPWSRPWTLLVLLHWLRRHGLLEG